MFFRKIMHCRRIFGHFEKMARHCMAALNVVATLIWTR
jgi:hypothetical protein